MIYPEKDMTRWEYCDNTVVLANADAYYTKGQIDKKLDDIVMSGGTSPSEVQEMIDESIKTKADKEEVNVLAQQVAENTRAILERYTKGEVNALLANYKTKLEANKDIAEYAAINGTTLSLNNKNIGI